MTPDFCFNCGRETLNGESSLCDICIDELVAEQSHDEFDYGAERAPRPTVQGHIAARHLRLADTVAALVNKAARP